MQIAISIRCKVTFFPVEFVNAYFIAIVIVDESGFIVYGISLTGIIPPIQW